MYTVYTQSTLVTSRDSSLPVYGCKHVKQLRLLLGGGWPLPAEVTELTRCRKLARKLAARRENAQRVQHAIAQPSLPVRLFVRFSAIGHNASSRQPIDFPSGWDYCADAWL